MYSPQTEQKETVSTVSLTTWARFTHCFLIAWFEATQVMAVIGTGGTMAAAVMYYIFLFVTSFKNSVGFHAIVAVTMLLSSELYRCHVVYPSAAT